MTPGRRAPAWEAALLAIAVALLLAFTPCYAKGGEGSGGYSSGGSYSGGGSYSSGSSYYQPPYYSGTYGGSGYYGSGYRPTGYYGRPGYGTSGYGSTSRGGGSSVFWWLICPALLICLLCICCKRRKKLMGANGGGIPHAGPRPPRSAGKHYSAMRRCNAAFLRGAAPSPYLGAAQPPVRPANGSQFQLPEVGRPTRWIGSYTENGATRHTRYELFFQQRGGYSSHEGHISGSGADEDGGFTLEGDYNLRTGRFVWREAYPSGMKAAVQQQGSTRDGTFITGMAGTFAADTGLSGGLSLAPDAEAGFHQAAPNPVANALNPQAVLGGAHYTAPAGAGYPPSGGGAPPAGYPAAASHQPYAPSAPAYPSAPPGTGSYFAYPPAYGVPAQPAGDAGWLRGVSAEEVNDDADDADKPNPKV
eukprot:jgi/Tetstr1/426119/TSEL_016447.t1